MCNIYVCLFSNLQDGLTPLHCGARSGHEQVVEMLLDRGAPILSKTKVRYSVLHLKKMHILSSFTHANVFPNFFCGTQKGDILNNLHAALFHMLRINGNFMCHTE